MARKRRGFCSCDKLTFKPNVGWFEALLLKFVPHFDIIKTIDTLCPYCVLDCDYCEGKNVKEVTLYLRRFYLWRSSWIGCNFGDLYLHKIYRSDDDPDPHDHPWDFLTFVLKGGYLNETHGFYNALGGDDGKTPYGYRTRTPGNDEVLFAPAIRKRKRGHIHRVILADNEPAWTLVWTSGYKRDGKGDADWAFYTIKQRVPWRVYLGLDGNEEHGG